MKHNRLQGAAAARPNPSLRANPPVRLPQATADLVERLLAARCGSR